MMMSAAVLYVYTGVGGCWWTISSRTVLMDVTFYQFSNNPPDSTSVADAITFLIRMHPKCTGTFSGGISCTGVLDFVSRKIPSGSALCPWF